MKHAIEIWLLTPKGNMVLIQFSDMGADGLKTYRIENGEPVLIEHRSVNGEILFLSKDLTNNI